MYASCQQSQIKVELGVLLTWNWRNKRADMSETVKINVNMCKNGRRKKARTRRRNKVEEKEEQKEEKQENNSKQRTNKANV